MTSRVGQFCALSGLTATEVSRRPICLLLVLCCLCLMALAPFQAYQFGEEGKIARDGAFAAYLVFGLLLGAYGACTVLTRELRSGTAAAVLAKPVSRDTLFLAKFSGVAVLILGYSVCAIPALLLCEKASPKLYLFERHAAAVLWAVPPAACAVAAVINYRWRRPFASTAFWLLAAMMLLGLFLAALVPDHAAAETSVGGRVITLDRSVQWRLLPAALLVTMALLVLSAISLMLAARFNTVAVVAFSAAALFLGLLSDYLFGGGAARRGSLVALAHRIVPDWQHFWLTDRLVAGGTVQWSYVGVAGAYAALYLAGVLCAGMLLFRAREVK